jgi:hypothetical protein
VCSTVRLFRRHDQRESAQRLGEVVARLVHFVLADLHAVVVLELDEESGTGETRAIIMAYR